MRPDLVIFDCDGVLVDSEQITNQVMVERFAQYGLTLTVEEVMSRFVGGTIAGVADAVRAGGTDLPEDWVPETYAAMFARLRQHTPLIPGVPELLDRLDAASIPYCIGSNGPMAKMEITLTQNALWSRFEGRIFSAHDVGIAKPDPGLYLHAAAAMGFTPAQCVVVEDSGTGAKAARAAGMRCFGYAAETPPERLTAQGAIVFTDMKALPSHLGI